MGCCRKRTQWNPIAKLCTQELQSGLLLELCPEWFDNDCNPDERKAEWTFSLNGNVVVTRSLDSLNTPINIGIDSTYSGLNLPNGTDDLIDFLEYNGHAVEEGDEIEVVVSIINCHGLQSRANANFTFIKNDESPYWLTPNGEPWTTLSDQPFEHF